jgi:hypothetical protein
MFNRTRFLLLNSLFQSSLVIAIGSTFILLEGCGAGAGNPSNAASYSDVAFETALLGNSSGISALQTVIVRNAADWEALWTLHATFMAPMPEAPARDFQGRQMVGVFLGARRDGCTSVQVTAVRHSQQTLLVQYRETRTGGNCVQVMTQPYHLVWVPASTLPVFFERN